MILREKRIRKDSYLKALQERVLIYDGAMGTSLERQMAVADVPADGRLAICNDLLNLNAPERVETVHLSFLEAGADVIETNTFRSNILTLSEFGLAQQAEAINLSGARIARHCADHYSTLDHPRFVAGAMGPSGKTLSLGHLGEDGVGFGEVQAAYHHQAAALLAGGADVLLLETQQDILEVKAAILGIRQAMQEAGLSVPLQVQVTLDAAGRMLTGTDVLAALTILEGMGIDVFGINCSTGPDLMRQPLQVLSAHCSLPLVCQPNAGLPLNQDGAAVYSLCAEDFSAELAEFVSQYGLAVVGGCCGTTPHHIRMLRERIGFQCVKTRQVMPAARLASAFHVVEMRQQPSPFIIGERLNAQGSRRFKEMMLKRDFNAALELAEAQLREGAHALDVCVALSEHGEENQRMAQLVRLLGSRVDAPLVVDTTDVKVMESALQNYPGRCLLNSVNLEKGEAHAGEVLALARHYGAAVIALTIDEAGMAQTAAHKLAVAQRITRLAVDRYGLKVSDMVIDPLTFTLASGSQATAQAGVETLEAISRIKRELPGVLVCLGVSNISYGLPPGARTVLNSVFLYHALQAGLDMAILHAAQVRALPDILPRWRGLAEDLIFNRVPSALMNFINAVQDGDDQVKSLQLHTIESLPLAERIRRRIIDRIPSGLTQDLDDYIQQDMDGKLAERALELLNSVLLPAMQEIGEQFGRGDLILPFVLASAEIMQAASKHVGKYLDQGSARHRGRVVLATVYGDVHDIGKNLVATILANNGYEVIDLGKQVPADAILDAVIDKKADAVGLSALLVSTSLQMPLVARTLRQNGYGIPLLLGGAAVNTAFAERINRDLESLDEDGNVHYCRDAFDALKILEKIASHHKPSTNKAEIGNVPKRNSLEPVSHIKPDESSGSSDAVPCPPFWGYRLIDEIPVDQLLERINRAALYRLAWGVRNVKGEQWERYQREFNQRLERMRSDLTRDPWLQASALYGYWPCQSAGDELIIYREDSTGLFELARFAFPRQPQAPYRCLSDFFQPVESGQMDLAAFQIVTVGGRAVEYVARLQRSGEIAEAFYAHGLAVQLTETAAAYMHDQIRRDLGLPERQGKRYAWGYPALPDLAQHETLLGFLPVREALGIHLTSAFQFVPEYATAALILHHANAVYFK